MRALIHLLAIALPVLASAGQVLQYEPDVVQVSGTLAKGRHEHPNGTWFDVLILKLSEPASIKGDGEKDSINVSENNIREIQIFSKDDALVKRMSALAGRKTKLTGTLFHSHTAWHVRELVMMVTSVD